MKGAAEILARDELRAQLIGNMPRLWRYGLVLSRRRDLAEVLVQKTCQRAITSWDDEPRRTRLDGWLFCILHSVWSNDIGIRTVDLGRADIELDSIKLDSGGLDIDIKPAGHQILRKVNRLPEAERAAVFLTYVEGFSYRDAASILGISIETVMIRLTAARVKFSNDVASDTNKHSDGRE